MDLSIIVPCYNEVENVPKIQRELIPVVADLTATQSVELIFVDDGSTDHTWQALMETFGRIEGLSAEVKFARHEVNRGLGAALRTGFTVALGQVVVTTDSDGTYKFSTIPAMLSYLTPEIDVVTASPYHPAGEVVGVSGYRLVLSRGSSAIYRLLVDRHIHTYTCLFRAYRREMVESISFESDGYLAGTELLVEGLLAGYRVAEYPTALHRRVFGDSKAKLLRTIFAHLRFQGIVLLRRLRLMQFGELRMVRGEKQWA